MTKRTIHSLVKESVIALICFYQHSFSILLGPSCRFFPSCSSYASLSIQRFGIVGGSWLAFKRFVRCHPFGPGGYDPVPEIPKNS